ncbi:hypothetical protein TNCV_2384491 [Trichonephila clavipes]|nr:hypothetical protein TNCV_2384491 [Trichonephila clavipes]
MSIKSTATHLSSPSTNHTRRLAARRLFRAPPYHKGTKHLQTSMSFPGFEPSPYGTTFSIGISTFAELVHSPSAVITFLVRHRLGDTNYHKYTGEGRYTKCCKFRLFRHSSFRFNKESCPTRF